MGAALKVNRSFPIYTLALALLTVFAGGANSGARADDADLAQVLRTLKALESRVATLESEKQQYRREAASARAETQALKQKLGYQPAPASSPKLPPTDSYAMVMQTPVPLSVPTWGGRYAGASFGLTSQHANQEGFESDTSTSMFSQPNFSQVSSFSDSSFSSLGGRGFGATANLYLGYDYLLLNNFLVGAEIEGGLSNTRTTMAGGMSGLQQNVTSATNFGVSSTSTSTSTTSGTTILNMENRWVVSALARGGFVIDPKDLIYLVGGITYGSFELIDQSSIGAFGGTVGAGWERKITPSWTFKAEYRYTRFQDRTATESVVSSTSSAVGVSTNDSSVSSKITGLDWHSVSIGVSHYFDAN
jgi:opacity protein-like surface antigen